MLVDVWERGPQLAKPAASMALELPYVQRCSACCVGSQALCSIRSGGE